MDSTVVLVIIYISVVLSFKDLQEIALFAWWLIFTLYKTRFSSRKIMITFIGFSGLTLSLRQSRQRHLGEIEALTTAMIIHFLISSKTFLLILVEQMYSTLKKLYKTYSVCVKVIFISFLIAAMIIFCMGLVCYGIDKVLEWINNGPFYTKSNFITVHGKFHSVVQIVDISDDDLSIAQNSFTVGEHQSSLSSYRYFSHKDTNSLPLTKHLIHAYPGEEAELNCCIQVRLPGNGHVNALSLFFEQDSVQVRNTLRRRIHLPDEKIQNGSMYTFSLTLLDIRSEDFGLYRAGLRTVTRFGSTCSVSFATMYQCVDVRDEYACVFNLTRIDEHFEYVDAPVGALLYFEHLYLRSKSDYLRVEHYVNGMPVSITSNISSKCCLPSVQFISEVVWHVGTLNLPWNNMVYDKHLQLSEVLGMVCTCSSLYGIHRFKFYNDIYDTHRKKWMTSEFWHPQITVIYPKSSNMPWNSISERESRLIDSSKNERNFSIFEGYAFELLQNNLDEDFVLMKTIDNCLILWVFCILISVAFLSFFYFLKLVSTFREYAYERLGLIIRVKFPDTGGNLANVLPIRDDFQCYHHDVFVLNVDDDRTFVLHELHPVLLKKKLSVFLSEEDLPPGPTIENLKQALTISKKVIVVVSDSFINYKLYNNFFLPHIILRRLDKGIINSGHLMLLVSEPCRVPESLIKDDRIVTLDYTRNSKDIFLRKLNEWLESPVIRQGFAKQPMLHSDLLQLFQV
ncbi:hypothetical protein CHS0354_021575 [Potamilus streckersoni]|nr:hypothetical protein CHS0354_021575 [Potamilus streckersoni]